MHYPLVGERVWVSGCRDEFIVAGTDYSTCVAAILPTENMGASRRSMPFGLLFAFEDFAAAQDNAVDAPCHRSVLRSSLLCISHARVLMKEMRYTVRTTMDTIRRSQELIAESDRLIARSKTMEGFQIPASSRDERALETGVKADVAGTTVNREVTSESQPGAKPIPFLSILRQLPAVVSAG